MSKSGILFGGIFLACLGMGFTVPAVPAAAAPAVAPAGPAMRRVEWVGKTADWNDPANWSVAAVPTANDIAVFDQRPGEIANQPRVMGTVKVGGIWFESTGGKLKPKIPGEKNGAILIAPVTWTITGTGTIVLGAGGITTKGTHIIYPGIELAGPQTWTIGVTFIIPTLYETWADTVGFNAASVVLRGPLSGTGPITKVNDGKVFYCNNASPTFSGGAIVRGGWIDWAPVGLDAAAKFSFGTGPITLDCGYLSFGAAACKDSSCTSDLTNPLIVTARGGGLYYSQEGPADHTPDTHFSGPIDLGGPLIISHSTAGSTHSNVELLGSIAVNEQSAATPLITLSGAYRGVLCRGPIAAGPGDAGNPLVLRSDDNPLALLNPHNTFDGLTVIGICGGQAFDPITNSGVVDIAADSRLGKAGAIIEPGGRLNLNSPANFPAGATVTVRSNSLALGEIGVTYDGSPPLTADSDGVVAIDAPAFDAVTDLSKLGDGRMWLGSRDHGEFTGTQLAPGAGDVYRLGGGSFGGVPGKGWPKTAFPLQSGAMLEHYLAKDHWLRHGSLLNPAGNAGSIVGGGLLVIDHGVLAGDAAVEVGSTQWLGNIAVVLEGANSFTGPLHIAGPMQSGFIFGFCGRGSSLEGVEQQSADQSPFGSPASSVDLLSSTLKLTAVPGGQPVAKGDLSYAGASTIALDANVDNLASLTLANLTRKDRAVLAIDPQQEKLGDKERLLVSAWSKDVDLLPPYMLYASTKDWAISWVKTGGKVLPTPAADCSTGPDFLAYDATGHTGFTRFTHYATDLASAKTTAVVRTGPTTLPAGDYTVRALRATGPVAGKDATVHITTGGLILSSDFAPNLDFGSAEGVIYGTDLHSVGGQSAYYHITGKVSGTNGLTFLGGPLPWGFDFDIPASCGTVLANPANDFTGPITIEGDAVLIAPDSIAGGKIIHGSLGDEHNPITLDGGILCLPKGPPKDAALADTRTIHLAPGGGYFHCSYGSWTIDSKITGPGFLGQTNEGGGTLIITNPVNDYAGGTLVDTRIRVAPAATLGTGPVMMCPDASLVLQGDHNLNPAVRITASHSSVVSFESSSPRIGSLDGSGLIWLGSDAIQPPAKLATSAIDLTIGSDNTDSTFFGAIRQGLGITGSLTKAGTGVFTLFGGHSYTGPTTVAAGTLVLAGSVAGDVIVDKGATFILKGTVAGNVHVQPGATFQNHGHVLGKISGQQPPA